MMPKTHIVFGLIGAVVLYFGFDVGLWNCLIFWLSSFLIDVDHYLFYVWKKRDWNLWESFRWFVVKKRKFEKLGREERKKILNAWCFLHGFEVVLILILLGYFVWDGFYFVVAGFLFHLVMDWIDLIKKVGRADKVSIVWDWVKFGRLGKI